MARASAPRHTNNFDGLRLLGAMAVIVGHAYYLLGRGSGAPIVLGYQIHALGVVVFFSISGYLIAGSWQRKRRLPSYLLSRCLRIFPALLLVVALTTLVIGPAMSTLKTGQYFAEPGTWRYLWANVRLEPRYDLPGVFAQLPFPTAVNGSLWTLPAEFFCYLVVPCLLFSRPAVGATLLAAAFAATQLLAAVPQDESPVIYGTRISDAAAMWSFFAIGALLWLAVEWKPGFMRTDVAIALVIGYLCLISVKPTWTPHIAPLALPYAVIAVGRSSTQGLRSASRYGDFSYGMYLWAFPVQQVLIAMFGRMGLLVDVPLVSLISFALAILSWRLVEARALAVRSRVSAIQGNRREVAADRLFSPGSPASGGRKLRTTAAVVAAPRDPSVNATDEEVARLESPSERSAGSGRASASVPPQSPGVEVP